MAYTDTARGEDRYLYPNLSAAEGGPDDIFNFTSNGFILMELMRTGMRQEEHTST